MEDGTTTFHCGEEKGICPLLGRRSAAPSAAAAFSDGGIGEKKGSHPSRFTVYPLIPTKLATLYPVKLGI